MHRALISLVLLTVPAVAGAVDFAVLSPETWEAFAPQGKEVDAIYGDFVLRNEAVVAVIAQPLSTRNANMTVRGVGGMVIDLTERSPQNDQLSCYFPGGGRYQFTSPEKVRLVVDGQPKGAPGNDSSKIAGANSVALEMDADPAEGRPRLTVRYSLAKDAPHLVVETIHSNPTDKPIEDSLSDAIRADRTFTFGFDAGTGCFWADDEWFRQAYGLVVPGYEVKGTGQRGTLLNLLKGGSEKLKLEPGQSLTVSRQWFPAGSLLAARGWASQLAGQATGRVKLEVSDGQPVPQAKVVLSLGDKPYANGRTDEAGRLMFALSEGEYQVEVLSIDGRVAKGSMVGGKDQEVPLKLDKASYVSATIANAAGQPSPAKVSFTGKDGTKDPDWGPDSGEIAVKNVYYTHNGAFKQPIAPGKYDVIVSYGPEHDAVFTTIEVPAGGTAELKATLRRTVDTTGWISADFHSHSSPSGDNTSSQLGRVLNLFCEQIDFAPCTEHNRIDTYVPHLKRLGIEGRMATCTGMELTGGPLPVNHQNAFPLAFKPHTQDGGAPATDTNPEVQIERLALWDNKSDKLVQMNHPNLPQILGDRDLDGQADAGFRRMFGFVDVIEVHPPQGIFDPPEKDAAGKLERNPIFHWMQMLNFGRRHTGVINTDSHYNYHESGFFRNFIRSLNDEPQHIDTLEIVKSAEAGHVVVSTGPFLSVSAKAATAEGRVVEAIPGDDLVAAKGTCELSVRVQCPNWLDVNRVQVFLNGRPAPDLNFTRRSHPDLFTSDVVRFQKQVSLKLPVDTHVIVATIGEGLTLGPVMGPNYGGKLPPVAVANPIFVDIDGKGFVPNRDLLDVPIAGLPPDELGGK